MLLKRTNSTVAGLLRILQYALGTAAVVALGLLSNLLAGHRDFQGWIYGNSNSQRNLVIAIAICALAVIAIEIWRNPTSEGLKDAPPDPEDLTAYRTFLTDYKCNALQLAVMHPSAQELDRKVLLWSIFVPQSARESAPIPEIPPEIQRRLREEGYLSKLTDKDELAEQSRRYQSSAVRPIFEILDRNRQVVVVGDPGAGKTSLLKYRALQWAKHDLGPLPLFVELSSYARDEAHRGIVEYCQASLQVHHVSAAQLEARLQAGRAAFYLDGLDEIFDRPARKRAIDEIVTLCATYPQAQIAVTTRKVGYEPERLRNAGFLHATLEEFDDPQISKFLDQWHQEAENDIARRDQLSKRIAGAIAQSRAIRELAGNPLLLTMMAILNRNQELPRDRVKLYEQASQVLLHEWDWTGKMLAADAEKIERPEKEKLLRILAGEMQQVEGGLAGNLIQRDRLVNVFRAFLEDLGFSDALPNALALVQQLTERNFILAYAGGDRFCFVHRTFLEYFCAAWFVERMGLLEGSAGYLSFAELRDEVFGGHWKDETWHEVLRLIAGMVHETKAGELIRFLMEQDGRNEKLANLMLAAGCLSEVRNRGAIQTTVQSLWQRFVEQAIRFDPPYYYEPYAELGECGPTRQAAVRWMALAWKNEDTRAWLRSAAVKDRDWIVQQAAVQELARGWKDDPGTLPWLQDRARGNENRAVRQAAVQELARGWKDDPGTLPLLQDRARNDESEDVRQAAVQELGRGWKDDPGTLPLLQDRARNDERLVVRQVALVELARGWKDDPGTLPWLQDRARNDEHGDVRQAAVQALARLEGRSRHTAVASGPRPQR